MDGLIREVRRELASRCDWARHFDIGVEGRNMNGSGNFILLTGRTGTYYQKQMAQEAALTIIRRRQGVELLNEIVVD